MHSLFSSHGSLMTEQRRRSEAGLGSCPDIAFGETAVRLPEARFSRAREARREGSTRRVPRWQAKPPIVPPRCTGLIRQDGLGRVLFQTFH